MYLVYVDDSGDSQVYGYSALVLPAHEFRPTLERVKTYRRKLHASDGIFINKELHAVDFCTGRGRLGKTTVSKWRRCEIFKQTLREIATLPNVRLLNAFGSRNDKLRTLERLVNRINRYMKSLKSHGLLIFDEGEERAYTKLVRQMGVFNPVASRHGLWPDGSQYRNIPIEHVIEDPHFKRSRQSYFIQLADFCGYALLQKERPPTTPWRIAQRLDEAFLELDPICVKEANSRDPFGIVR